MNATRLSRLRNALRARDWLGIGIELIVVTLGVLLAFQIDQWGDRRQQAREERQFLERLYVENRASGEELKGVIGVHDTVIREVGAAIRARSQPSVLASFSGQEDYGCGISSLPPAPYNDTASGELVASGRLNLITDPDLRSIIRQLTASQAEGAAQIDNGRQQLLYTLPAIEPYYSLVVDDRNLPICFIQWTGVARDRVALNAATRLLRRHVFTSRARHKTLALTEQLDRRLACKLDKPECGR